MIRDEPRHLPLYLLCLATFVTYLSTHLIIPIIPVLAERLGALELEVAAASGVGVITLSLFQVLTGALADRFGRRRAIAFGAILGALTSLLCVSARSWMHLTLLRGLGGVADAIIGPALLALIAEVGGEEKGWAMGLFRGSQGIAIILGPIVGGVLAHYLGLYIPFYLDFTLTLLGVSLFFIPPIPEGERAESLLLPLKTLRLLRDEPRLLRAALIGFSELFSFGAFLTFLPALAISLELSDVEIASLLTLEAALFSLTNLVVGPLSDKVGRKPIAALGLLTYIIVLPSFPYAHSLWHLLSLAALYGAGSSAIYLMSSTMAADLLPSEGMATLFAAFDALMDLGLLLGPTLCLMVLALLRLGARYAFPIMLAPALIALPLLLSMEETRPPRNPRGESPTADRP